MEILDAMGIVERFLHGGVRNDGYIFNFLGHEDKAAPGLHAFTDPFPVRAHVQSKRNRKKPARSFGAGSGPRNRMECGVNQYRATRAG